MDARTRRRRRRHGFFHRWYRSITKTLKQEPVQVQGLLQTLFGVAVVLGWMKLEPTQVGAILAVSASFLALVAKTQVTPLANPHDADGKPLTAFAASTNGSGDEMNGVPLGKGSGASSAH
jgi:hypothetical protein